MSDQRSETDINNQEESANKLKALAQLYSYLGRLEKAFEGLQKESGKLMLAENANENFEAYYKFITPISSELTNIKNLAKLSRSELRKYKGYSSYDIFNDSSSKRKKENRQTEKKSYPTTPFEQLERRVDELEFYLRLILLLLIAVFVVLTVLLLYAK
ncbi:MAG: hypothetical protein QNJ55_31540 [Xenococcus sp. MO_188.B8]|nr:hypothetical protein [Xenococcus sp. MO_188.B8]